MSPLVLMLLDGFGYRQDTQHNAIASARMPHWKQWWRTQPHCLLEASGLSVGLPSEQMGNSEVGHMHIGAGRCILQDFTRINQAIIEGEFARHPLLLQAIKEQKQSSSALHVMGLLSPGGVHSHEDHLFAFLQLCAQQQANRVYLHLFLDGRDTPPKSAIASLQKLQQITASMPFVSIATITGRYYAMDRDQRWSRLEPVYQLLTTGVCTHHAKTAEQAIESFYQQGISDEFIPPTQIGNPAVIQSNDSIFFFNFRADRARQLSEAFLSNHFQGFSRIKSPILAHYITMTPYADYLPTEAIFPHQPIRQTLGEVLAQHGLKQLRIAETEKYAHVTFFFNGGNESVFPLEERILIPSPSVATYDQKPEMSAPQLTQRIVDAIHSQAYDVIICNYANADMVGHTGNFPATVKAIETLDEAMGAIEQALRARGGHLLITADHGNAEAMFDEQTHQAHTAHTMSPVPFLYVGASSWRTTKTQGNLYDIAPTILTVLGIQPPPEMTGQSLLVAHHD